jgi:hypothetical protein
MPGVLAFINMRATLATPCAMRSPWTNETLSYAHEAFHLKNLVQTQRLAQGTTQTEAIRRLQPTEGPSVKANPRVALQD